LHIKTHLKLIKLFWRPNQQVLNNAELVRGGEIHNKEKGKDTKNDKEQKLLKLVNFAALPVLLQIQNNLEVLTSTYKVGINTYKIIRNINLM